ncbi:uncharacterized protein LOC120435248 [Oreochromis aureus]|uniref:uncharacterized protein LOC120435248 n=1 Tax=Oreochromis aureus TaxID=47969 RepID=UPI001953AE6E|nr:uncharacterized protein LOC120435248 [Oreochromis aureus]XP_039460345.1 uncharacterized protein LOC120435248 [Oreochromis aureus]XP_039460346.1 uncharacterized protein LOC120435248 [Oreochromis aureus]
MKLCHILLCSIFLYLQDGNTGLANAETPVYEGVEGGNITAECRIYFSGSTMSLCKEKCETGNVLIETTGYTAQSGRYSIKFEKNYFSSNIVYVNITQLQKSDSGQYMCTLGSNSDNFNIVVTEASDTSTPNQPLSTSTFLLSASTTTTTQHLNFSSRSFTASSTSSEVSRQPQTAAGSDKLLHVILILVAMITILSAALLIFYKHRKNKPKGPPVKTEHADITQANWLYGNITEDETQNSVIPVRVSSVHDYPEGSQPDGVENQEHYSLVTAPQNTVNKIMV